VRQFGRKKCVAHVACCPLYLLSFICYHNSQKTVSVNSSSSCAAALNPITGYFCLYVKQGKPIKCSHHLLQNQNDSTCMLSEEANSVNVSISETAELHKQHFLVIALYKDIY